MRAPPPEVAVDRSLEPLAPKFRAAIEAVLAEMGDAKVSEATRTFARQSFLYGFGREYDDGRGIVTNAASNLRKYVLGATSETTGGPTSPGLRGK